MANLLALPPLPTPRVPVLVKGLMAGGRARQLVPPKKVKSALAVVLDRVLLLGLPRLLVHAPLVRDLPQLGAVKQVLVLQPFTVLLAPLVLAVLVPLLVPQGRRLHVRTLAHPPVPPPPVDSLLILAVLFVAQRVYLGLQLPPPARRAPVRKKAPPVRVVGDL